MALSCNLHVRLLFWQVLNENDKATSTQNTAEKNPLNFSKESSEA